LRVGWFGIATATFERHEGHTDDLRVFWRELPKDVLRGAGFGLSLSQFLASARVIREELVADATKGTACDLLAKATENQSAQAHDVGDSVRIPAFGEHGHGNDAADVRAECVSFANSVHYLAENLDVRIFSAAP